MLGYFEDLTEAQTAELMGCSVGTVKSQASTTLSKLRVQVGPVAGVLSRGPGDDPMSPTLRDVLARQANNTGAPGLDLDAAVGLGEHWLRRRRVTTVLASAAAVVVVVAVAVGVSPKTPVAAATARSGSRSAQRARRPPHSRSARSSGATATSAPGSTSATGEVRVPESHVHIDVTDHGFVYLEEGGRLWFSDGGAARRIETTVRDASQSGPFGRPSGMSRRGRVNSGPRRRHC